MINDIADQQAEKGHTADASLGEVRGREMEEALLFTKLDQKGMAITLKGEHLLLWTKALQRRMKRTDELGAVTNAQQGGTKTANFLLRPGEGREFLGKALQTCTGHAASIMLKAISITLPTRQILHKWFPKEHTRATYELWKGRGIDCSFHL